MASGTNGRGPSAPRPGKAEAFNKTLQNEWAYAHVYTSNEERLAALPEFLDRYNNHRTHSGISWLPPA